MKRGRQEGAHRRPATIEPPSGGRNFPDSMRRRVFMTVTIALPFLSLLLFEATLRWASYGGDLSLVVKRKTGNRETWVINRAVARRYFTQAGAVVPEPAEDAFAIHKPAGTKRIFFLGESTMAGFPYEFHATAPSFLGDRLRALLPDHNIEIVNVGISAVGSYVVDDFIDEVTSYEPDLLVVYLGHNEFYGVYGAGSSITSRARPWMTRLTMWLLHSKFFLLLRDGYNRIGSLITPASPPSGATLMGQMIGNQHIPYQSEVYRNALTAYEENLASIITKSRHAGVPIIFSTLVSNVRDLPPFRDLVADSLEGHEAGRMTQLLGAGDRLAEGGDAQGAIKAYRSLLGRFPSSPTGWYRLGKAQMLAGDSMPARTSLLRAKDLDALRFRATEEFQDTLIAQCRRFGVPLARADSAFAAASPGRMSGHELILEHLHPNLEGYFLLAKTWATAIYQSGLLAPSSEWHWVDLPSDSALMAASTVSAFDRVVGEIKVTLLTHRWPFVNGDVPFTFVPRSPVESVAYDYVLKKIAWSDARYRLSDYYASIVRFDDARRECRAVARVLTESYQPVLRIADLYRMEGKNEEAYEAYQASLRAEDNPYSRLKAAIILLERNDPREAAHSIEAALSMVKAGQGKFPRAAASGARYLLGVAYAKLGRTGDAIAELRQALEINPEDSEARLLLKQLTGQ